MDNVALSKMGKEAGHPHCPAAYLSTMGRVSRLRSALTLLWLIVGIVSLFLLFQTGLKPLGSGPGPEGVEIKQPWWRSFLCPLHTPVEDGRSSLPLRLLMRDDTPGRKNMNLFLLETSCKTSPTHRAWCSVESWARQNPNLDIWFILTSPTADTSDGMLNMLLKRYPNIHVASSNLDSIFEGTPLQELFESRKWSSKETWPVEVLSDMVRVLLLWHWGGYYSDTDVICIKPMDLTGNMMGFESEAGMIGSAFLGFTSHHQLLWRLMKLMKINFKPQDWGSIGPKAITRVMKKECQVKHLRQLVDQTPISCDNVNLYPVHYFYPLSFEKSQVYLEKGGGRNFTKEFQSSYMLHIWNKLTKNHQVTVGNDSIYEVAAKSFCPLTFQKVTSNSSSF